MAQSKPTGEAIRKATEALKGQGRDVTTSAILSTLAAEGIKAKSSDLHASAPWKELLAKEDQEQEVPASEPPKAPKRTTKEPTVAKTKKKRAFPSKPCPKCGAAIHARLQKHEKCGWIMASKSTPAPATKKKVGRPRKVTSDAGGISLEDIQAVKALADRLGADKVWQLATVLAK